MDILVVDDQSFMNEYRSLFEGHRLIEIASADEVYRFFDGDPHPTLPDPPYNIGLALVDLVLGSDVPNGIGALLRIRDELPRTQTKVCLISAEKDYMRDLYPVIAAEAYGGPLLLIIKTKYDMTRAGELARLVSYNLANGAEPPVSFHGLGVAQPLLIQGLQANNRPKTLGRWLFDSQWKLEVWKRLAAGYTFANACRYAHIEQPYASEVLGQVACGLRACGGRFLELKGELNLRTLSSSAEWRDLYADRQSQINWFVGQYSVVLTDPGVHKLALN